MGSSHTDHDTPDEDSDAPPLITAREDFHSILDDFLDNFEIVGNKMKPVLAGDSATAKLETLRRAMTGVEMNEEEESKESIKRLVTEGDQTEEDIYMPYDIDEVKDRWDCETILSKPPPEYSSLFSLSQNSFYQQVPIRI